MNKKNLMFAISFGLIISFTTPVLAEPTTGTAPSNPTLTFEQQQQFTKESSIEKLDNQIQKLMSQVEDQNKELTQKQEEINIQTDKLNDLTEKLSEKTRLFSKRARALYIASETTYLSIILESNGMSDLISRVDNIKKIMKFDNDTIKEIKETKEVAEKLQSSLIVENNKLLSLKRQNEEQLSDLETKKKTEESILAQIKADIEAKRIKEAQERAKALEEKNTYNIPESTSKDIQDMLNQINSRKVKTPTVSRGPNINGDDIVDYVSNFLGTPYLWGGTTPYGFDCSGFVQYVYSHFDIRINRTTYEQVNQGQTVSNGQLQAGDLLFFGGSDIHHVGMYIGNGLYIHAPRTGDVIKISSLAARNDFTIAKRFIK